jgi:hypothetical protein
LQLPDTNGTGFTLLDEPQPPVERRRQASRRLELLLGGVLLLCIIGWAVWDSWRTQGQYTAYHAGERAAANRDWDAALAAFRAATGFRDAAARAAGAATKIADRDQHYAAAVAEAGRDDWLAALRDLRAVNAVQPGFRDSETRQARAVQVVYSGVLSGTIARRPAADPPGLYIYDAQGWVWLRGSDGASIVRGAGEGCVALYDAPAPEGGARALVVARPQPTGLVFQRLRFTPDFDVARCGPHGVMTERRDGPPEASSDPRLRLAQGPYSNTTLHFQSYESAVTTTFALPGPAWAIVGYGNSGETILLADYSHNSDQQARSDLYLVDLAGGMRFLATRSAVVMAAQVSPDGQSAIITELALPETGTIAYTHRLVDLALDSSRAPAVLRTWADEPPLAGSWFWSSFVDAGPYAGKVVAGGTAPWDSEIWLINPTQPGAIIWKTTGAQDEQLATLYALDSGILLTWTDLARSRQGRSLFIDAAGAARPLDLDRAPDQWLWGVWERNNRLIYATAGGTSDTGQAINNAIRSVPLALGRPSPALLAISYAGDQGAPGVSDSSVSWNVGALGLAVVQNGALHALSYDGSVDLVLERGIDELYPLP